MTAVFADSYYWLALINPRDAAYSEAETLSQSFDRPLVTSAWVLAEVGDAMRKSANRSIFMQLIHDLAADPDTSVIPASQTQFDYGVRLFADRPDKDWSLTDCISMNIMKELRLTEVLSADRHFAQAGFTLLMQP
jgi:predicted nucleic acid-binding protein